MSEEEYSEEEVSEEESEEEEEVKAPPPPPKEDPEEAKRKAEEERKRKAEEDKKAAEQRRIDEASKAERSKEEEARLKEEEKERKKAEVRARMEAQSAQKSQKGFLTGARKRKLKAFLRKKIREDMEAEQKRQEQERQQILSQRIKPVSTDGKNEHQLKELIAELYKRVIELDEEKYTLEQEIAHGDKSINDLTVAVNKLRGKFVKPVLKKVSKYDKLVKMTKATERPETDWRSTLKPTGESKYKVESDTGDKKKEKPEWAAKKAAEAAAPAQA